MRGTGWIIPSFLFDLRNYVVWKEDESEFNSRRLAIWAEATFLCNRMFPLPKIPSPHLLIWQMSNEQLSWPLRSCPWPLHQHTSRPQTHTQWFPSYGPLGTLCSAVIIWLRASLPSFTPKTPSPIKTKVACCFSSGPTFLPCTQSKSPINVFIFPSGWMNEQGMCRGAGGGAIWP